MKRKKINFLSLIALIFVIVALPTVIMTLRYGKKAVAAWFDDRWGYRTAINITNSGAAVANQKVKLDIDTAALYTAGKIKINCDDSRFTDANGKSLQYYLDSAGGACNTNSTDYYVLMPTINAGTTTIYHYYGNPSATKGSVNAQFSQATFTQSATSAATEEQSKAPVAYWKFDEGTGTTTYDSTSNKNNGTLGTGSSAPTWQTEDMCVSGKCLKFDGSNDYVSRISTDSLRISADLSIGAWVYLNNTGVEQTILGKWDESNNTRSYRLWISSTNKLSLSLSNDGTSGNTYTVTGSTSLSANKWYFLQGIADVGTNMKVYVDGRQDGSDIGGNPPAISVNLSPLYIGTKKNSSGNLDTFLNGKIDEVKIYPYARSSAEIKTDYNARGSLKGSSLQSKDDPYKALSQGLVGYWKMDEASWNGTANEVVDSSGNANHGVGVGATKPTTGAGKFGNGGDFNGLNNYADIADNVLWNFANNDFSIGMWANFDSVTDYRDLIGQSNGGETQDKWMIGYNFPSTNQISFHMNGSTIKNITASWTASTGRWYHIVFTRQSNTWKFYIDGANISSETYTGTVPNSTSTMKIGVDGELWKYFDGKMDEVRIYNRSLSPAEVRQLYNWAPGPVGYWDFNTGIGTSVPDISGNGNNGIWNGTGTHWATGKVGKAGKFNGSNDYVDVGSGANLNITGNVTVSAWIKPQPGSGQQGIVGKDLRSYVLYVRHLAADDVGFCFTTTSNLRYAITAGTLTYGNWYYVTGVWDGTLTYIYINGILSKSSNNTIAETRTFNGINIGYISNIGSPNYFNGLIDEVRIYNYARTQKQIVEDMNAGHPAGGSPVGSQIGYWKFDEGYGTTVNNSGNAGSSINGTLGSSPRTPSWTNNGKFGKALSFDASTPANGDIVNVPDNAGLQATTGLTISAWINPNTRVPSQTEWVVGRPLGVSPWDDYNLTRSGNNISMQVRLASGMITATATNAVATTGIWYHLLGTYDAITGKLDLYINGQNKGSASGTGNIQVSSVRLKIGGWYTGADGLDTTTPFNGLIDEVKIYNYALTQDEVAIDYNRGQAMQMGTLSSGTGNTAPPSASSQEYCIPGDTVTCSPPIARWDFNEGVGSTAYDTSGNGNTTYFAAGNAAPSWSSGKIGKALSFDGSNDYTTISTNIPTLTEGTIEMWTKRRVATATYQMLFTDSGSKFEMCWNSATNLQFYVNNVGVGTTNASSLNTWYHLVGTFSSTGNFQRVYINGILANSSTYPGEATTATKYFGSRAGSYAFNGLIDDVRVFNYARSPAQIAWDYNKGAPVAWYKMDECQGTTAHNSQPSTTNLDGTINIGATAPQTSAGTCTDGLSTSAWYNGANGKYNASLNFDGADDQVTTTTTGFPSGASVGSEFSWIKTSSATGTQVMWIYGTNVTGQWRGLALLTAPNRILFTGKARDCEVTVSVADGNWHHVGYTYNGGTGITIFVDAKAYNCTLPSALNTVLATHFIGMDPQGVGINPFVGQIDDVKIFNYALNATQVKLLYNAGAAVQFAPLTGSP